MNININIRADSADDYKAAIKALMDGAGMVGFDKHTCTAQSGGKPAAHLPQTGLGRASGAHDRDGAGWGRMAARARTTSIPARPTS